MPEGVAGGVFLDSRQPDSPLYCSLDALLVRMMPFYLPGIWARRSARRRKNVLPASLVPCLGILSG